MLEIPKLPEETGSTLIIPPQKYFPCCLLSSLRVIKHIHYIMNPAPDEKYVCSLFY